ncbi:hypothetical protein XENOCAPTIV_030169, partial [Xenoophorus captivus]
LNVDNLLLSLNHQAMWSQPQDSWLLGLSVCCNTARWSVARWERTLTAQTIISLEVPQEDREEETGPLPVTSFSHDSRSCEGITDKS